MTVKVGFFGDKTVDIKKLMNKKLGKPKANVNGLEYTIKETKNDKWR